MKLFKKMLLVCSFFVFHQNIYCGVDSDALESIAVAYGYKTANLQALNHFITENAADGITIPAFFDEDEVKRFEIAVPEFRRISSGEVKAFLKDNDLDVDARWNELVETHVWTQEDKPEKVAQILKDKKLPTAFLAAIKVLSGQIKTKLKETVFEFNEEAQTFIGQAENGEKKLVVRSTGREDTDEMANAGGNETVVNIEPDAQKITEAMGDVAVSYISEKSLTQRLAVAKTAEQVEEIFSAPFMPVLVQIMIGEKVDGEEIATADDIKKVPVSGVMFTTEADGSTPGVMHVDMTFGQGEGVVSSLVAVDTFYVGDTTFTNDYRIVHSIIREKKQRMVPVSSGGLKALPNTREMEKSLCVDEKTVLCLKELAVKIEEYYDKPMDVEFVVEPAKKIIYLVQARPIVFEMNRSLSYLNLSDEVKGQIGTGNILNGVTTGMGDGGVKVITSADQIMLETTLLSALGKYMAKNGEERKKIKCVLTKEAAAALSHEATTFRAENMSVLQLDDADTLSGWIAAGEFPILVDVQREVAIKWHDRNLKNLEQLRGVSDSTSSDIAAGASEAVDRRSVTNGILKDGWFTSPIPQQESLIDKRFEPLEQELQALFAALGTVRKKDGVDLRILIEELKNSKATDRPEVLKIVKKILRRLFDQAKKQDSSPGKKEAKRLVKYAAMSVIEILKAIESAENPRDLRVLYAINFLEAILFQQPSRTVVGGYSYLKLLKTTEEESRALSKVAAPESERRITTISEAVIASSELPKLKTQLIRLSEQAFVENTGDDWVEFVNKLEETAESAGKAKSRIQLLSRIVMELDKLDLLPMWLNVQFYFKWSDAQANAKETLLMLVNEYKSAKEFLEELKKRKAFLGQFDISKFEDPALFEKQWEYFKEKLIAYFKSDELISIFSDPREIKGLDQLAALNVMTQLVEKFDSSIKMMKGSTRYKVEDKVKNFRKMLAEYLELFEKLVTAVPAGTYRSPSGRDQLDIRRYLVWLKDKFNVMNDNEERHLSTTLGFNVGAIAISSAATLKRHPLRTLEEVFTVVHQNLLIVIGSLSKYFLKLGEIEKPEILHKIELTSLGLLAQGTSYFPVGVEFKSKKLSLFYNMPLFNHSAKFELSYDKKQNKAFFQMEIFGRRPERWTSIGLWVKIFALLFNVELLKIDIKELGFVFNFGIDPIRDFPLLDFGSFLSITAKNTMRGASEQEYENLFIDKTTPEEDQKSILLLIAQTKYDDINIVPEIVKFLEPLIKYVIGIDYAKKFLIDYLNKDFKNSSKGTLAIYKSLISLREESIKKILINLASSNMISRDDIKRRNALEFFLFISRSEGYPGENVPAYIMRLFTFFGNYNWIAGDEWEILLLFELLDTFNQHLKTRVNKQSDVYQGFYKDINRLFNKVKAKLDNRKKKLIHSGDEGEEAASAE